MTPCKEVLGGFSAPTGHGYFHTSGTQIYAENSIPIRFRGLNDVSLLGSSGTAMAEPNWTGVANTFTAYGLNSVRLAWAWDHIEPTAPTVGPDGNLIHHYDQAAIDLVMKVAKGYWDRNIYTIPSPMQQHFWGNLPWSGQGGLSHGQGFPAWIYPNASSITMDQARCKFWQNAQVEAGVPGTFWKCYTEYMADMMKLFAGNKMVPAVDIFNEPYAYICGPIQQNLDGFYQVVGDAIRAVNSDIILIAADSQYAPSGGRLRSMTKRPVFDNMIYGHHLYSVGWDFSSGGSPLGLDVQNEYLANSVLYQMPIWNGEFVGFDYVNSGDPTDLDSLHKMMMYLKLKNISWSYFALMGNPGGLTNVDGSLKTRAATVLAELAAG